MGAYASREEIPPGTPRRPRLGARPTGSPGTSTPRPLLDEAALRDAQRFPAQSPVRYRSPLQRSGIVQAPVTLRKDALSVVPDESDGRLAVQFDFGATVPGYISVFFGARQVVHRSAPGPDKLPADAPVRRVAYEQFSPDGEARRREKTRFGTGKAMRYRQKAGRGMSVDEIGEERATKVVDGHYPIVVRFEVRYPKDTPVPRRQRIVSQCTFATLERGNDGEWGVKVIRQEVLVAGTIYVIQELYGIGAVDVTASKPPATPDADGSGEKDNVFSIDASNECVICLIEPCNTAVLPCNHLCLCQDCGAKLSTDPSLDRRRCPICRTDLESLLRIIPTAMPPDRHAEHVPAAGGTGASASASGPGPRAGIDPVEEDQVDVRQADMERMDGDRIDVDAENRAAGERAVESLLDAVVNLAVEDAAEPAAVREVERVAERVVDESVEEPAGPSPDRYSEEGSRDLVDAETDAVEGSTSEPKAVVAEERMARRADVDDPPSNIGLTAASSQVTDELPEEDNLTEDTLSSDISDEASREEDGAVTALMPLSRVLQQDAMGDVARTEAAAAASAVPS